MVASRSTVLRWQFELVWSLFEFHLGRLETDDFLWEPTGLTQVLDQTVDLDAPTAFPWQNDPEESVAHTIAWVNAELMKNATEIGQLRLLRSARNTE
ncbi:hypothetical protein AB0E01_14785 [Nocardia vinacea]|uniref:hypothetical protein n=1 Tax=Nocardia vinacea TaxID=96468 RepID=UPI0033D47B0C